MLIKRATFLWSFILDLMYGWSKDDKIAIIFQFSFLNNYKWAIDFNLSCAIAQVFWFNWPTGLLRVSCRDPRVRGLQPTHRGPFHPQSAGPSLAQQVPEVQRLSGAAGGEMLQQRRQRLLQRGFLQVKLKPHVSNPISVRGTSRW